jgi:hypothetical protein
MGAAGARRRRRAGGRRTGGLAQGRPLRCVSRPRGARRRNGEEVTPFGYEGLLGKYSLRS